ncbi:AT-rich interactive domain-containing protein 2 [Rhizophlyctis rosea]|nr:AT-rich interactive domain-containing protein 2 [Rhizophlyctis rosea]
MVEYSSTMMSGSGKSTPKGTPRAIEDGIERTAEYDAFMSQLEEFHRKQGTTLQREPVLGGKKLDLFRIYKWVQEAGGYAKVTEERGWKKVTMPFDLPPTCTNSAFVVKQLYQRFLYNWEQVHVYSVPHHTLPKRPFENADTASVGSGGGDKRKSAPSTVKQKPSSLQQPMVPYSPPVTEPPAKRMRYNGPSQPTAMQMPPHPQLGMFGQPPPPKAMESIRPTIPNPDADGRDEKYLAGNWKSRLLLSLQSGLPNETDWAFNKLIKLSYTQNFYLGIVPGLLDSLLDYAQPFFDNLRLNRSAVDFETTKLDTPKNPSHPVPPMMEISLFNTRDMAVTLERTVQVLHILRNLSFVPDNAVEFTRSYLLMTYLAKGMALPSTTFHVEIKHHTLDIFENMAAHHVLRAPNDFYLACLRNTVLTSTDKSLICSAVRSMTRLCGVEVNQDVLARGVDDVIVGRMVELLLVPDEEVVSCVLDWMYEVSGLGSDVCERIGRGGGRGWGRAVGGGVGREEGEDGEGSGAGVGGEEERFNIMKLLTKFLHWRGFRGGVGAGNGGAPGAGVGASAVGRPMGGGVGGVSTNGVGAAPGAAGGLKTIGNPLIGGLVGKLGGSGMGGGETFRPEETNGPAVAHAMKWLSDMYMSDPTGIVSPSDVYKHYVSTVGRVGHQGVSADKLTSLILLSFPTSTLEKGGGVPIVKGVRSRLEGATESAATSVAGDFEGVAMEGNGGTGSGEGTPVEGGVVGVNGTLDGKGGEGGVSPGGSERGVEEGAGGGDGAVPTVVAKVVPPKYCCWWGRGQMGSGGEFSRGQQQQQQTPPPCAFGCNTEAELLKHVQTEHVPPGPERYECHWKGCSAFLGSKSAKTRGRILAHLSTHAPLTSSPPPPTPASSTPYPPSTLNLYPLYAPPSVNPYIVEEDLRGIPLTTLLVLRNLAKCEGNKGMFLGLEGGLSHLMMTQGKLCSGLAGVLGELG